MSRKALTATKIVKPVVSGNAQDARRAVLGTYKQLQRMTPKLWWDYELHDIPLPLLREMFKNEYVKHKHLQDIRVIDRKVEEAKQHMNSMNFNFYTSPMIRNYLLGENIEAKPKDFLSRFLECKD
ncbi:NADH dehydrogenase [ubiquinone] 1 alpha subcomplex subunit 6 [Ditylenchus destructor]|nr:NADH dehydrogenase [ubiquinone] 1 alpha subcomplex subunit 6 [Ditylenchus destructor]